MVQAMASGGPVVAAAVNAVADVVIPGETRLFGAACLVQAAGRGAAVGVRHRTCSYHRAVSQLA
jgi:hypothetical protein